MTLAPLANSNWLPPASLFADLRNPQTYRSGLYLLLTLPVSLLVITVLSSGLLVGAVTLPLLIGFAILPLALLSLLWLNALQRWLAQLLGLELGRLTQPAGQLSPSGWLQFQLRQPALWRGAVFQLVALPLAVISWAVLGTALLLTLGALAGACWPLLGLELMVGQQVVNVTWPLQAALGVAGLGGLIMSAALVQQLGMLWAALAWALLRPDDTLAQAQRALQALGQAAGQVALGENLSATLTQIAEQARVGSGAAGIQLAGPGTHVQAGVPLELPGTFPLNAELERQADGAVLASLPIRVAGLPWGALYARFSSQPPSAEALTLLNGLAHQASTALHAARLAERAAGRAEEEERARLARELHDSVAQALYGISLGAKTARATLEQPERARASLDYTIQLAEGAVSEMKALLFSLRPDALAEGGLLAALQQQVHVLQTRHGLQVQTRWDEEPQLPAAAQTAVYRIALEALHNVVKHAGASQVVIELTEQDGTLHLSVQDNGRGFDPQRCLSGTLGQRSMRERAAELGGQLDIQSVPGQGTCIRLELPLAPLTFPRPAPFPVTSAPQEVQP